MKQSERFFEVIKVEVLAYASSFVSYLYGTGKKRNTNRVSVREECLKCSRPNEISIAGINSAILKTKEAT
jgi:hypothetical protein